MTLHSDPDISTDGFRIIFSSPATGDGDIYEFDMLANKARLLTNAIQMESQAQYSADDSKIVYVRDVDGYRQVWMMNSDGTSQEQVTSSLYNHDSPSFSPDNKQIVFSRFLDSFPGTSELFVLTLADRSETRITSNNDADHWPSFTPEERIVYSKWAEEIWIMDVDGNNAALICHGSSPSVASDGQRIVCITGEYGNQVSVFNIESGSGQVVLESDQYYSCPSFVPGKNQIVVLAESDGSGTGIVTLVDIESATVQTLVDTQMPTIERSTE